VKHQTNIAIVVPHHKPPLGPADAAGMMQGPPATGPSSDGRRRSGFAWSWRAWCSRAIPSRRPCSCRRSKRRRQASSVRRREAARGLTRASIESCGRDPDGAPATKPGRTSLQRSEAAAPSEAVAAAFSPSLRSPAPSTARPARPGTCSNRRRQAAFRHRSGKGAPA
jgi:hypothetical protein